MGYQTKIHKPVFEGTTPRLTFQIVDEDSVGFQPDTLTMSIYDVMSSPPVPTLAEAIVNGRNDVNILNTCDVNGNVVLVLASGDTDVDVPAGAVPATLPRRILFAWTWGNPVRVGKHQVLIEILPDRETEAT